MQENQAGHSGEAQLRPHPLTLADLRGMHARGERIAMLTCYDASFASLMDRCGVDALFVGDSLGNVIQGHGSTLPVTVADIAYHVSCVARGNRTAFLLADLPFGACASPAAAYTHAAQLMRAGAQMVKIEGGAWLAETVDHLVRRGIPVCAHVGLMPQCVHQLGGFKIQGRNSETAGLVLRDAAALQDAGASLIVIEAVPAGLGKALTESLSIPTIGIGAGPDCSGQVLVMHDMLGITEGKRKRFVRDFMAGNSDIAGAIRAFVEAVKCGSFPAHEHCYK